MVSLKSVRGEREAVVRSRLKELVAIRERELGQEIRSSQIAEVTNLDIHTVMRWMKPQPFQRIEVSAALKLCNFLDCELGELLFIDYRSAS